MKSEERVLETCQVINFTQSDTLFGCLEPIKYKIIFEGLGIEATSCQSHYEFFRSEVERTGILEKVKFVEINNDNPKA
jgi:vacuolar-type H+-ATPase subunit B/Vma2